MDLNNEPLPEDAQPSVDGGDWRSQLPPGLRQQNVEKLGDTFKKHIHVCGQDAKNCEQELEGNAIRCEEVIHDIAKSESDYMLKISLRLLQADPESKITLPNDLPSISIGMGTNLQDSGFLTSNAQTTNTGDWQEEVYQRIKTMKDHYFAELDDMYQKIFKKLQKVESDPQFTKIDQLEKFRMFKAILEKLMQVLQISKNNIQYSHKEKLQSFEKQIVGLLSTNRLMQQVQQPHCQISQAPHEVGVNIDTRRPGQGSAPSSTHQMPELHQNNVNGNISQGLLPQVTCYHNEIVPLRVVEYDGPAVGKRFYACSYWPKTCGFFKWVDEVDEVHELQPNRERPGKKSKIDFE